MNKTRMGKRVASLLLSLVMMLSLLPTAAYAAMGDADETQGASVSENGTRVSDDSNSGGDTGDLQVGDSEDGGNTGDQKVEGSNGSNTVGDTAGTEGGADPTDSVNENDSTLVTPSNRVEVNGTVYDTLEAAIAAAEPVNGVITYEIYGKVEANSTESWIEVLKAGLTDVTKVAFVGKTDDAEISITNSTSVLADQNYDIDVSFVDLTLSHSNGAWVGDIGHATEYFTCVLRNTDAANNTVTYTNCTFPNGACNNQYGKTVFVNCEFTNTTSGKYNLWNYGGTTEITKSAFTGTRGIKTYNEGTLAESPEVAIKDTTFTGLTEKAAIVASKPTDIKLDSISATECTKGVFQKDIEGSADAEKVTIEANGSGISGNFNVTAEKTTEAAKDEFNITAGSFTAEVPSDYCAEGFTIEKKADGSYGVKENQPSANVAKVGDTEYATLGEAIAALSSSSYTLELLDESAWDVATPVYWAAGSESGYVATLADALTAAYMANAGGITIVCRPGTDVGKLTHGHVADNITIYGNNAYISSGECDLEVDTYMFSRDTGKQVTTGGAYLDKDITVTAYELDNLGVWGQRHTGHKVTVNLTDCDSVHGITVQRVYISGTTGVNDITLTGCDFGTKATSVYSNADGKVVIDNCSFTGAQVPVNFNHKANGTQTVTVQNSKFTNCGDNGDWKQFAAPVRFVNSGSGTMNTTVGTCTFTDTVGGNGDILLGDGREGEKSNNVSLTVENTAANVQAQQPGYYAKNGTTDESKQGTKNVAADDKLTTSVTQLMPSSETTYVAEVKGVKYKSLQAAIDAASRNATVTMLADTRENVTISTNYLTLDLNGHTLSGGTVAGKPALTVTSRVTVKDSSPAQTGTIMREDTAENSGVSSHYVIDIQGANAFLKFEGGTVKNNSGNKKGNGASLVRVGDDSVAGGSPTLTITGGTFTQDNFIVIKVDRGTFYLTGGTLNSQNDYAVENWKSATIKGGTVNGAVAAWTYSGGNNSTLTISGGTVNGDVLSVNYGSAEGKVAKVSITGGTVNGALGTYTYGNGLIPIEDPAKATIAVTGGTFSNDPTKYVVENSGVTPNGDGTFGVAKAYLAKVGDTSYYTMDEAFKAQTASGEAIVLLRDYTTGSTFNSGTVKRTVDLNGHTWTCTGKDANSAAFEINNPNATLIVKNGKVVSSQLVGLIPSANSMSGPIAYDNSTLEFEGVEMTTTAHSGIETNGNNTNDTVTLRNSTLNVPNGFGIYFPSSGTLTIDNSKINAKTMGVQVCSGSLNISGAGTAITVSGDGIDKTINDGAIEDGAAISIVNRIGYKGLDEIKVEGGTFTANGTNAAVKAYDWDNTNKTESDFTQAAKVSVSGGTFSSEVDKSLCAKGYIPTQNADGTYSVKEGKFVAEVGTTKYQTLAEAIDAAQDGQTVTLLADATEDVVISKSITLDLGGKTLTNTNAGNATISVKSGTVTVKNGNVVGGNDYYNIEVTKGSNANLTLTDVTATAGNNGSSMIDNWGTLTITSGTYTGGLNVVKSEEGSVLNISGGTFTLTKGNSNGFTGVVFNYGELTISGGEFIQSDKSAPYGQAQVIHTDKDKNGSAAPSTVITGGTFKNLCTRTTAWTVRATNAADGATKVSGGAFNKEVKDYYCADGFIPTKNADGTYGVKEGKFVAEVGSKKYETLADAIRLATKGKTVKLLADVEQNTQLTINKSITLDLNGKTIRNTVDIWGDKANAILSITNGAKVTITGNGTIDAKENDCYTINVAKGDLTIENGTFYGNVSVVQVEEGTLSVKGGTFDLHQKWEGSSKYLFNCIDSEFTSGNAKVAISGGTFVGFDPNVSPEQKVDGKTPSFAAPGVGITKNENGSFTAAAGMTAQILDKDGNSVKAYNTLAEAVAAAQDGQTVRLLADVTLNEQIATGKAITIDGQSKYTIKTVKKLASVDGKAGMFYRTQSAKGTLTFLNVTLDGGGVSKIFLNEGGAGETVFDGVTSTNGGGIAYGSGIHISGGGSHATIRNSTLTGSTGTMELNDANYYAANDLWVGGNVYVTVENSVIGNVFVNSAPSATATNGVVHGQLTITGEKTKITYLSGEEEAADKLDKFGNNGSLVKIDSGYVEKVFDKGSYAISGGTFKTEVKKEWCAAGYVPTQNGDGTYGVAEGKFTVMVTSRTTGSDSPVANVAGGGSDITYAVGTTVTASAISGYKFVGWFVNEYTGTPYSTDLTCEVKPTADCTMIAVYEPISGGKFWLNVTASEFTVNGGAVQDSYLYEQFAVGASVTVEFTGTENFLYWVNASNKVVSTDKSYTFIMGSETTLKAVYGKARQNQATVVFISHSDQIISSKAYTTSDTIQFPVPPIKMGCTFTGWSMTEAEIRAAMANNSGIIQVRARYTEPSIACKVTVIYPDGIGNDVVNAVVGKAVNVTAKDIEGKTFSYWTDNAGNVLGYTKTLNLAPSGDMTVKAVYDEAAEAKPVITISEVSATTANESYVVTFMATRAVPDGYKVVKQGILWSRDAVCGEDGAAAYMQFDSNGKLPTGVNAYIGNSLELNGVTRLDITTKYNDRTFYGRGYMVLESDAGELLYIYTNTIESGSYGSLTK